MGKFKALSLHPSSTMNKQKFIPLIIVIGIVTFSSIPYWLGKSLETENLIFRGAYIDTADYAVHLSMMQAGRSGEWAYQMRFTSEEHTPAYIRLFYIFLGHISRWFNLEIEFIFQTARWVFGITALWTIWLLFQKLFSNAKTATLTLLLTSLGGGIGWLQLIIGAPLEPISPIDLWLIDAYMLFSIALFPAFSFTLSLMAIALFLFLEYLENAQWQYILGVCISAVLSQLFNPIAFASIDIAMCGAVIFTCLKNKKIEWKQVSALGVIALTQIPLLIYNLLILVRDPVWSQFTAQNETLSPPLIFYIWGFLPFWTFAIFGVFYSLREKNIPMSTMIFWVCAAFLLAYSPTLIQRRFLLGITIPLGALAIYGMQKLIEKIPASLHFIKKRSALLIFTYISIASISSLFLILNSSLYIYTKPANLFYSQDLLQASQWLDKNASLQDLVLASQETSQIFAQTTPLKMYFGHEMETLYFDKKQAEVFAYYEGRSSNEWLTQTPVKWVIYGPYEVKINNNFVAGENLSLVYENETVKIFKVIK